MGNIHYTRLPTQEITTPGATPVARTYEKLYHNLTELEKKLFVDELRHQWALYLNFSITYNYHKQYVIKFNNGSRLHFCKSRGLLELVEFVSTLNRPFILDTSDPDGNIMIRFVVDPR